MKGQRVKLNRTGRIYILMYNWEPVGTAEENKIRRESGKCYYDSHFGDYVAWAQIEKNEKPFGRVWVLFKSEVTEMPD